MNLLVGVDLSGSAEKVVQQAEKIARALSARVWLLHITMPEPADYFIAGSGPDSVGVKVDSQSYRDALAKRFHREHQQIQEIADRLRKQGLDATALLVEGEEVEAVLNEASKLNADMIILGSHGRGAMYQLLVGSVSEGVLHKAECPVLVVPTHDRT